MKLKLAAVAVALLLVGTGAATAMPGNAPEGVPADDAETDDGSTTGDEAAGSEERPRRGPPSGVPAADGQNGGPPVDLPAQVPDFVSGVHDAIGDRALSGAELGERLASLTPGSDDASDGNATDAPGDAGSADTPADGASTPSSAR